MNKLAVCFFLMFLFIQNLFSQQNNVMVLYFQNVPKNFIDLPCRNMEDCAEIVKSMYYIQDTLYVLYDVDTLKIRNIAMIDGYTNKRHNYKTSMIIPDKNKQKTFNYITIQWENKTYLFKKKQRYFIFQNKQIVDVPNL